MSTRLYDDEPGPPGVGRDRVTGLWGPGPFAAAVDREAAVAERHERSGAVVVIGVRGMGGAEDDDLRRGIAAALRARLRATDMVARLDDADFGVLLVEAPTALGALGRRPARRSVQHAVGSAMPVAAGITVYPAGGPRSGAALLADAEVALLEAREGAGPAVTFETGPGPRPRGPRRAHVARRAPAPGARARRLGARVAAGGRDRDRRRAPAGPVRGPPAARRRRRRHRVAAGRRALRSRPRARRVRARPGGRAGRAARGRARRSASCGCGSAGRRSPTARSCGG